MRRCARLEKHAFGQAGRQLFQGALTVRSRWHANVDARESPAQPKPLLRLRDIREQQRLVARTRATDRADQLRVVRRAADADSERAIDADAEPRCRAGRQHGRTRLREPASDRPDAAARAGRFTSDIRCAARAGRFSANVRLAAHRCIHQRVDAHELQGLVADVDIAIDDRRKRDGRARCLQADIQQFVHAARAAANRMGGRAVHRLHRELERPAGARRGDVDRDDGRHAQRQPQQRQRQLRRVAQQMSHARGPERVHE